MSDGCHPASTLFWAPCGTLVGKVGYPRCAQTWANAAKCQGSQSGPTWTQPRSTQPTWAPLRAQIGSAQKLYGKKFLG